MRNQEIEMSEELALRQVGSTEVIHWARPTGQGPPCVGLEDKDRTLQGAEIS